MYGSVSEADSSVSVPGSGPHSLLSLVRSNRAGLSRLREDHLHILDTIRNSDSNAILGKISQYLEKASTMAILLFKHKTGF